MTEKESKEKIFPIIYLKGRQETSDLKNILPSWLELSEKDLEMSKTRKEAKYKQNLIGNIISHMSGNIWNSEYGYQISKTANSKNALFSIQRGLIVKENLQEYMTNELGKERMDEIKYDFTECDYPELIKIAVEFEKDRVAAFAGDQSLRVYDIVNDFPKIAKQVPWHILSINETGDPISIVVEKCEFPDPNNLSKNTQAFVNSRYLETSSGEPSKYLFDKSFVYFIDAYNKISILSTQECRKDEN